MDAITLYNIRRDERQLQRYKQRKEQRSKQKIIDDYRSRRDGRLDANDVQWVTMHGKHIPIGANGEFMAGPLKGQKYEKGKKETAGEAKPKKMTRKQLAEEIWDMRMKEGSIQGKVSKDTWVKRMLNGGGAMGPRSLESLEDEHRNLKEFEGKSFAERTKASENREKAKKLKSDFDKYNKEINGIEPSDEKAGSKAEKDGDITKYRNDLSKKSLDSYEVQKQDEKKITPILQKVSDEVGAGMVGLPFSVKTAESVDNKINRKIQDGLKKGIKISPDEAFGAMTDNVRYTQVSDKENLVDNVQKTIETLEKNGYSLYELDNKWLDGNGKMIEAGYRGVHSLFKAPSGTIFELQFHTPHNAAAKEKGHKYYDQQKELKKVGVGKDDERWKELDRKMDEIYSAFEIPKGIEKLKNKEKGG